MNNESKNTYIRAQVACAFIEAMGMKADNKQREIEGYSPAYTLKDFVKLIERYGIHHNAVIDMLRD